MGGGETRLRLGTRGSPLALAQARETRERLAQAHGWDVEAVEIVVIRTTGDAIQDRALSEAGGKGLFTKELDMALVDRRIDLAVHSAKDLPTLLPTEIALAGYLPREDARDALISRDGGGVATLPRGATVGSASLRRSAQLRRLRPDVDVSLLRGNVETRLRRVAEGDFDATLLAMAGLKRLRLDGHVSQCLPMEQFLPAVGQGAIAIASRSDDGATRDALAPILHADTHAAVGCERAFLAVLDGSCRTPIAGHATILDGLVAFRGQVLAPDGRDHVEVALSGPRESADRLGAAAGRDLLARMTPALRARLVTTT